MVVFDRCVSRIGQLGSCQQIFHREEEEPPLAGGGTGFQYVFFVTQSETRNSAGERARKGDRRKKEGAVNGERCIEFLLLQGNDDYGVNNGRKNTMRKNSSESARSGRLIESAQLNKVVP